MKYSALFYFITLFIFFSCTNPKNETAEENHNYPVPKNHLLMDDSQTGRRNKIYLLEDSLFRSTQLDPGMARRAIEMYTSYQKIYWADSLSPEYLYKAAEISEHLGFPTKAIELYQDCYDYYPNFTYRPECLFRIANIYEFTVKDYATAKQTYFDIIKFHKDSPIAKDAKIAMGNIGKADEDLIREFEKKNNISREKK